MKSFQKSSSWIVDNVSSMKQERVTTKNIGRTTKHMCFFFQDAPTTGHALSPAPIIVTKRAAIARTPVTKKGRKSPVKLTAKLSAKDSADFEGLADMLKTPAPKKSRKSSAGLSTNSIFFCSVSFL